MIDFRFPRHLEGKEGLAGNVSRECNTILPYSLGYYSLMRLPRKELIHSSRATAFSTIAQGTSPDLLVWRLTGITTVAHRTVYIYIYIVYKVYIYIHTLKAAN